MQQCVVIPEDIGKKNRIIVSHLIMPIVLKQSGISMIGMKRPENMT
jgi:hypothetical protein